MPRWPQSVKIEGRPDAPPAEVVEEGAIQFRLQVPPLGYEQWFALQNTFVVARSQAEKAKHGWGRTVAILALLAILAGLVVYLLISHDVSLGVFMLIDDRLTMLGGWWFAALVAGLFFGAWVLMAIPGLIDGFKFHRGHFDATGRFHLPQEILLCDNGIVVANRDERIFTRWEAIDYRRRGEDYTWFLLTRPGGLIWLPEASIMASRDPDGVRALAKLA